MAAIDTKTEETPRKSFKIPIFVGLFLAVVTGGAGFYAVFSGLLPLGESQPEKISESTVPTPEVAFIPLEPMMISLAPNSGNRQLRFNAQLEVEAAQTAKVRELLPRIIDVLNTYLRAVETSDLENPAALQTLRSQMLRRIQIVVGPDRVRDVLIMEFILN